MGVGAERGDGGLLGLNTFSHIGSGMGVGSVKQPLI